MRWYPHARRLWLRVHRMLGWPGVVGAMLVLGAGLLLAVLTPLQHDADALHMSLSQQRDALRKRAPPAAPQDAAAERARRYVESFPPPSQRADDVEQLFKSAQSAGVELPKGNFAPKTEQGSPFTVYTVTLPLRARYPALKVFVADVLESLPHASLEELRMTRADAGSGQLESVVRLALYYRQP